MPTKQYSLETSKPSKAQRRSISRSLLLITPETSNPQHASPLFSVLPPELRNQIFALACSQHRDKTHLDDSKGWHAKACRPGHQYAVRTCTSLLQTCRLVYYETRVIPLQSATHYIDTSLGWSSFDHYLFHLTGAQHVNLFHLHISGYSWGINDIKFIEKFTRGHGMYWKKITLAKSWHLEMPNSWVRWDGISRSNNVLPVRLPLSCSEFVFELEVLKNADPEWKQLTGYEGVDRLKELVWQLERYEILRIDGSCFAQKPSRVEWLSWSTLNKNKWEIRGAVAVGKPMECEVARVVWKGEALVSW